MAGAAILGRRVMWRVGTVVALHDETATARTITLEVSDWPGHVAGQQVDVRLTASDGYSAVRSYSIASAPNSDGRVELTVERLPNGEVSPYLTQELALGDRLELRGPIGGWFVWRTQQTEPILLVAGGFEGHVPVAISVARASTGSLCEDHFNEHPNMRKSRRNRKGETRTSAVRRRNNLQACVRFARDALVVGLRAAVGACDFRPKSIII
jgi:hypothetical protein